jgi:hypothetical protein
VAIDIEWQGLDTLIGVLRAAPDHVKQWTDNELLGVAYDVFNESQRQVPVDTGTLKNSGHVSSDGDEINISYGGAAAGYALWVHENLTARHKPPTKAKFLEDPFNEKIGELSNRLQAGIESAIVGQYPQQPSIAAGAATAAATHAGRSSPQSMSRSRGMTSEEIHQAIRNISRGKRGWQRKRTS